MERGLLFNSELSDSVAPDLCLCVSLGTGNQPLKADLYGGRTAGAHKYRSYADSDQTHWNRVLLEFKMIPIPSQMNRALPRNGLILSPWAQPFSLLTAPPDGLSSPFW
jgi:hypothetical protein